VEQERQEAWMRVALDCARRGMAAGEPPVGACIVDGATLISSAHNSVISHLDITAHAEIAAIREACRSERRLDLSGCELYSTVEPCPMCRAACHYAGITCITSGARLADMHELTSGELVLSLDGPKAGQAGVEHARDVLREECLELLQQWSSGVR